MNIVTSILGFLHLRLACSLVCYQCTYNNVTSDNALFNSVSSTVDKLNDNHCLFTAVGDETKVTTRQCPDPATGNTAMCMVIKGTAQTTAEIYFTKIHLVIQTVTRDCVEVAAGNSQYSEGCHRELSDTAYQLFGGNLQGVDIGEVNFNGQTCYYSTSFSHASLPTCVSWVFMTTMIIVALIDTWF